MFKAVIKVGGSLYHQPELRTSAALWGSLARGQRLLFLPGGGPFANQVRAADIQLRLSDDAAHWMAILAMDQYAYLLADLIPGAKLVRDLNSAELTCTAGQVAVLAPSTLLLHLDPLAHHWEITSDSIAAWLAKYAAIPLLVLLKSVAGVYQIEGRSTTLLRQVTRSALARLDLVDSCFTEILAPETTCWIIDGGQPSRLAELLLYGCTQGTQVV